MKILSIFPLAVSTTIAAFTKERDHKNRQRNEKKNRDKQPFFICLASLQVNGKMGYQSINVE